ncbi:hypothetical protein [Labrys neptuniae]
MQMEARIWCADLQIGILETGTFVDKEDADPAPSIDGAEKIGTPRFSNLSLQS